MGVDAKGRNFSAPRLTPGKRQEFMTYGSPNMLKDQERQIAVMEDRARRYGYMSSYQAAKLGGYTARPLGTNEGYNRPPVANMPAMSSRITTSTGARTAYRSGNSADGKKVVKIIIIVFVLFQLLPILFGFLAVIIEALGEL